MSFDIPNLVDAAFASQSKIFNSDLLGILGASAGGDTGVISGCAVTAQASPDMTLAVAGGSVKVAGVTASVSSGNVTITTAHSSLDRIDLVVVNSSGVKSVTAGTAAASPIQPAVPASSVALAQVYVPANDTAIGSTQIRDRRITVPAAATPSGWNTVTLTSDQTITSQTVQQSITGLSFSMAASTKYRLRWWVAGSIATLGGGWDANFTGATSPTLLHIREESYSTSSALDSSSQTRWDTGYPADNTIITSANNGITNWIGAGIIHNAGNTGTFQLQSAQNVSSGNSLVIRAGSYLEYATV